MNLQKEIDKYDKKKAKLRAAFVNKVVMYTEGLKVSLNKTQEVIKDLEDKVVTDSAALKHAENTLNNLD